MTSQFLSEDLPNSSIQRIPASAFASDRAIRWRVVAKEIQDKLLAAILVVLLSPVLALIALAVRLDSPGPILFRQTRVGLDNRNFTCLKFRSMRWEPAEDGAIKQTTRDDDRVTAVGAFIRKASLDELPQLFNVLRGDMSLVGPRPHAPSMRTEGLLCEDVVADYSLRHHVKPGITGLAQIKGHRGATETVAQLRARIAYDLEYVQNWTILMDARILLMTPVTVLSAENAF